jgi:hypothetical protein
MEISRECDDLHREIDQLIRQLQTGHSRSHCSSDLDYLPPRIAKDGRFDLQ